MNLHCFISFNFLVSSFSKLNTDHEEYFKCYFYFVFDIQHAKYISLFRRIYQYLKSLFILKNSFIAENLNKFINIRKASMNFKSLDFFNDSRWKNISFKEFWPPLYFLRNPLTNLLFSSANSLPTAINCALIYLTLSRIMIGIKCQFSKIDKRWIVELCERRIQRKSRVV